jgi:predicted transcriptional regulator
MSRFTLDLGNEMDSRLSRLASKKDANKAEILRRALITYEALTKEVDNTEDRHVAISEGDKVVKEVILP